MIRQKHIGLGLFLSLSVLFTAQASETDEPNAKLEFGPWRTIFDGKSLKGWKAIPRLHVGILNHPQGKKLTADTVAETVRQMHRKKANAEKRFNHLGDWQVVDGVIVGGQKPAGSRMGAYLISENVYGDFEIEYDIKPDWRTDTGVLIRQHPIGALGFQVLCDHRPKGSIGGIYANGLGGYMAAPFKITGDQGDKHTVNNLREDTWDTRFPPAKMHDTTNFEAFRKIWKVNDWNTFRVRSIGEMPIITIWINGLKIGTLKTYATEIPDYDVAQINRILHRKGHIGLEVHSNGGKGWDQWAVGAVSRWKNIRVREVLTVH